MSEEISKESKIKGILAFMDLKSRDELALFINAQNEAIEGLTENNKSLREAFRIQLNNN